MTEKLFESPYAVVRGWLGKVPRDLWVALASTYAIGLATHLYVFTNTLFLGDGLKYYYYEPNDRPAYTRFLLHYVEKLHNWLQIPWVIGLMELFLLALAIWVLYRLFRVEHLFTRLLMTGLVVTFPVLTTYNAHIFSAVGYALAMLTGVLCVWAVVQWPGRRRWVGVAVSAVLFVVSLGLYQAMLCLSATLMALLLIRGIVLGEKPPKKVFAEGGLFVLAFVAGLVLYLIIIAMLRQSWPTPESINYTRGLTFERVLGRTAAEWLADFWNAFSSVLYFYFKPGFLSFVRIRDNLAYLVIFAAAGVLTVLAGRRTGALKKPAYWVLLGLLTLLLPFTINMFQMLAPLEFRIIMYYALVLPLVYALWLVDWHIAQMKVKKQRSAVLSSWAVLLASLLLCFNYWMLANTCYLAMDNTYTKSLLLANRIVDTIQAMPGYNYGTPVVFVGGYETYPSDRPGFEVIEDMSGIYYNLAFHNTTYLPTFIEAQLGLPIYSRQDMEQAMLDDPRVQEMPNYPVAGSAQFIDEYLVIKFL